MTSLIDVGRCRCGATGTHLCDHAEDYFPPSLPPRPEKVVTDQQVAPSVIGLLGNAIGAAVRYAVRGVFG